MESTAPERSARSSLPLGQSWTVAGVHKKYGRFVARTLYRMGLRSPHLEDVFQEVFIVVQRRLKVFLGRGSMSSWLREICRRVAAAYRRRAHFRREVFAMDDTREGNVAGTTTSEVEVLPPHVTVLMASLATEGSPCPTAALVRAVLAYLESTERTLLILFAVDGLTCEQISETLAIPRSTVYSRLHRARTNFVRNLEREHPRHPILRC